MNHIREHLQHGLHTLGAARSARVVQGRHPRESHHIDEVFLPRKQRLKQLEVALPRRHVQGGQPVLVRLRDERGLERQQRSRSARVAALASDVQGGVGVLLVPFVYEGLCV